MFHSAVKDVTSVGGIGREGRGCVICFPAGNEFGRINSSWTLAFPEVITVGATDHHDVRWSYSSYGAALDLVAPSGCHDVAWCGSLTTFWNTDLTGPQGYDYINDDPTILDYTQYLNGTSISCPVGAGVAALVLSVEPNLTCEEVRHYLSRSARDLGDPGRDDYYGWGRVDARAALDMVLTSRADLNKDGIVDQKDLSILEQFMGTTEPLADIAPAAKPDGIVDELDRELMMQYWQIEYPEFGLVARWKLDETEGDIAFDSAGEYDGTLSGQPLWQAEGGQVGGALQFDGVDDCVITPFILNPADGPFSVFAWIQGGVPGQAIISQTDGPNGTGETWFGADTLEGKADDRITASGATGTHAADGFGCRHHQWRVAPCRPHRVGVPSQRAICRWNEGGF